MRRRLRGRAFAVVAPAAGALLLAGPATVLAHTAQQHLPEPAAAGRLPRRRGDRGRAVVRLRAVRGRPGGSAGPAPRARSRPRWVRYPLRAIGLIGWIWVVAQGIAGGTSAGDVTTLFLWVYGWVGVAMLSAFVGPVWHWIDPFTTIHDLGAAALRAVGFDGWSVAEYPAAIGRWPAIVGFVFFVWLELVGNGTGPRSLFIVMVGYTAFTLAMMAQFGRDAWRRDGETFHVWFGLLGRIAP